MSDETRPDMDHANMQVSCHVKQPRVVVNHQELIDSCYSLRINIGACNGSCGFGKHLDAPPMFFRSSQSSPSQTHRHAFPTIIFRPLAPHLLISASGHLPSQSPSAGRRSRLRHTRSVAFLCTPWRDVWGAGHKRTGPGWRSA